MANAHVYWIAAAVVLVFVEILTGTLYFLVFGLAASAAAAAAYFKAPIEVQGGVAAAVAIVAVVLVYWRRTRGNRASAERAN